MNATITSSTEIIGVVSLPVNFNECLVPKVAEIAARHGLIAIKDPPEWKRNNYLAFLEEKVPPQIFGIGCQAEVAAARAELAKIGVLFSDEDVLVRDTIAEIILFFANTPYGRFIRACASEKTT